ncbi:MAG: hypothetical protein L6V93_10395 [Clostridiales bacterium]|nr:MAG: hypothetical protein L6V93_10395 [Clostridiales bacterium]
MFLYEIDGTLKKTKIFLWQMQRLPQKCGRKRRFVRRYYKNTGTYTVVIDYSGF